MASNTFISKCISGKAKPADIDFYIDEWGRSNTPTSLYEFLGMTFEQFENWMLHAEELEDIIDSYRKRKGKKRGAANGRA